MNSMNIHGVEKIEIKSSDENNGSVWRIITITEHGRHFDIVLFPKDNDKSNLSIKIPSPVQYEI